MGFDKVELKKFDDAVFTVPEGYRKVGRFKGAISSLSEMSAARRVSAGAETSGSDDVSAADKPADEGEDADRDETKEAIEAGVKHDVKSKVSDHIGRHFGY